MQVASYIEALRVEGAMLAASAEQAGLDIDAPSCPGWSVQDVVAHTGVIHRWATAQILAAATTQSTKRSEAPTEDLLAWYAEGLDSLLEALTQAPADLRCWTFFGAPTALTFWARRQAHETAMHRADCDQARGAVTTYETAFATDGIDELLTGFLRPRRGNPTSGEPPRTLLIAPTDSMPRWRVSVLADRCEVSDEQPTETGWPETDCVVRASASDLYLLLWNRRPSAPADVDGDAGVLDCWRERACI